MHIFAHGAIPMKLDQSDILSLALLFLALFSSAGWYMAQADNELLRQEIEAQNYSKPVHNLDHEGK